MGLHLHAKLALMMAIVVMSLNSPAPLVGKSLGPGVFGVIVCVHKGLQHKDRTNLYSCVCSCHCCSKLIGSHFELSWPVP